MKLAPLALCMTFFASGAFAGAPDWVAGRDPRYPRDRYLLGVGLGTSRDSADVDARAELSRVFESNISAVQKDFMSAATAVNGSGKGVSVETQSVSRFQQITTTKTLAAVELREKAEDGGKFYTLAVLSREQCIGSLKEQIDGLDQKINEFLSRAATDDKFAALKTYGTALSLLDQREGLNAMLRVCDARGQGIPAPSSFASLAAKFDEATGNLKLALDLRGLGAARVRDCLMESLGNKGYQLSELQILDEEPQPGPEVTVPQGFDVVLRGVLHSEWAGDVSGSRLVRTELALKLVDPKTNRVVKTMNASRKEGRPTLIAAAALAGYRICTEEIPNLAQVIDATFKR